MNEEHTGGPYMTQDMEELQIGCKVNHLLGLLEDLYRQDRIDRGEWWVFKFHNLLDTLGTVTHRRHKYLQELHQELHQELLVTKDLHSIQGEKQ